MAALNCDCLVFAAFPVRLPVFFAFYCDWAAYYYCWLKRLIWLEAADGSLT